MKKKLSIVANVGIILFAMFWPWKSEYVHMDEWGSDREMWFEHRYPINSSIDYGQAVFTHFISIL